VVIKPIAILLVKVMPVSSTETEPASREDTHTGDGLVGIVLECVRRAAAHIAKVAEFHDRLEITVDRKVGSNRNDKLVRAIENGNVVAKDLALNICVPVITNVCRKIPPWL